MKKLLSKSLIWYANLASRERLLVLWAVIGMMCVSVYLACDEYFRYIDNLRRNTVQRQRDLEELNNLLARYDHQSRRLELVRETFTESQLTFEEVTTELDGLVRKSIGSDNYDLQQTKSPADIGDEFERQEFKIAIKELDLKQLVTLLYNIEYGKTPIFLSKLDMKRSPNHKSVAATLEISSVRQRPS